jgi:hypothetical protein
MTAVELAEQAYVDALGLDDGFGDWFAGFVDGEGSFNITPASSKRGYPCMTTVFGIHLREDDAPILYTIHERLKLGRVNHGVNKRANNAKPIAYWNVQALDACWQLCLILDRYPLRAKKAGDFRIWREAVEVRRSWPFRVPAERDWSRIYRLQYELLEWRKYQDGRWRNGAD